MRAIYEVYAKVVDANGAYNTLSGYPKVFDSNSYSNDPDKALKRAKGEFSETFGAMCKRDDRQIQTVILMSANGQILDSKTMGAFPDMTPQPEPEEGGEADA